jgi:ferric-dicitrate binding protein FerR (iron transport regulator)
MTSNDFQQAAEFIRNNVATDDSPGQLDHLRFAEALKRHYRNKTRNRVLGVAASAVLAVSIGFVASASMQPEILTYRVGSAQSVGTVGSYVSAPAEKPVEIHFSEGSDVLLAPSSRGRVAQVTPDGATMVLEDGRARADIVHRRGTRWQILAGPYVVGVTGTSFDVGFSVATQTFELSMHSGSVRVAGPGIKGTIEVRDQQRITLSTPSRAANMSAAAAAGTPAVVEATDAPSLGSVCPPDATAPREPAQKGPGGVGAGKPVETSRETFSQLGAKGEHRRIVELAEQSGLDAAMVRADKADLMALGNAARVLGKTALASKAYRAIRERFASSGDATTSAFFLGRLAEGGDAATAIGWYDKYTTEAPGGVWAAEALGRKLVLVHQLRGHNAAVAPAQDYLSRFPSGPYAGFARKILSL